MERLAITDIQVGVRHRKDMGDLDALATSIAEVGLLHPIVLTPEHHLIAGKRRLEAFKRLGHSEIPATIVDIDEIVRGEFAENTSRKDFLPSECVAILRTVEGRERELAKERQRLHGGTAPGKHSGQVSTSDNGRARDKAATHTGVSGRTAEKAKAIVEAAEAEPEKYNNLVADMDRTGRVDGPFRRLNVARQAEAIRREPPPLPNKGPYRVIVADPPWPYELRKADPSHRGTHPYPQMSIADICAVQVARIAHGDCILWLWTTNQHMREAFDVLDAWGFRQKTILTWAKDKMGMGDWLRGKTEHCLMAVRGKPIVTLTNQTTLFESPRTEHSKKPDEFYPFIEGLCPAPRYASLFHRGPALPNWDGHGDEVGNAT